MDTLSDEINDYLTRYAATLTHYDSAGAAALWGTPGLILSDEFAAATESREQMSAGLEQSYPLYRKLGLASVGHELIGVERITEAIVSVRVRWLFHDADGVQMTDGTNVYVLRKESGGWLAYVCVPTDETEKLRELAAAKGVDL